MPDSHTPYSANPLPDASTSASSEASVAGGVAAMAMSMTEHLTELRSRILWSVASVCIGFCAALWAAGPVIQALKHLSPKTVLFIQLTPGEALMASIKVMLVLGIGIASPVLLYHTLRFVQPGLKSHEKRWAVSLVLAGTFLLIFGVVFAWFWVLPPTLTWLVEYGEELAAVQMSIVRYVDFCLLMLLLTGLMFELPMVLFGLAMAGLVKSEQLIAQWRKAVVIIFFVAAIITPSQDPFSMAAVGLAMVALYLFSIIPIRLVGK